MLVFLLAVVLSQDPAAAPKWDAIPEEWGPEVKASLLSYAEQAESHRLKIIPKRKAPVAKTPAARREQAAEAKEQLARDKLEVAGVTLPVPIFDGPKRKGAIGTLSSLGQPKVKQIVDGRVIVSVPTYAVSQGRNGIKIVEPTGKSETYSILGMDTTSLADGEIIESDAVLICVGAKEYQTVIGATQTMWTFEVYPHSDYVKKWDALRIERHAEQKKKASSKPT